MVRSHIMTDRARESEALMGRKARKQLPETAPQAIQAARQFVGDDDTPLSPEEEAIIAEIKAEYGRPSKREIKELAKRLAKGAG